MADTSHSPDDGPSPRGLYLVHFSVHGLIRGEEPELGRDADTGGQVTYVLDLVRELGRRPEVARVDLITRRVEDAKIADDYARPEEELGPGVRLVRLPFGPRRYLRKEKLWPHLGQLVDATLEHLHRVEGETGLWPDLVHGHYADAGWVASRLSALLDLPQVQTGHSLGRSKQRRLLEAGMDQETLEERFHISRRIRAEETALEAADLVIASTHQEVEEQYATYEHGEPAKMEVVPPGVDLSRFEPSEDLLDAGGGDRAGGAGEGSGGGRPPIQGAVDRFLRRPDKPMVLALARPDPRKNLATLVEAYGGNRRLQEVANLVILAGNRDDVRDFESGPRKVMTELLLDVDRHDLYGRAAYPKHHEPDDVPDLYRLAARRGGVFVNPAFTEPFGLTLIEAAASGLPIVATDDGGPREIVSHCDNGVLIDPMDAEALGETLLEVLADRERWRRWSENGIRGAREHFSWQAHAEHYLQAVGEVLERHPPDPHHAAGALLEAERLALFDIDHTLLGDAEALERLVERLQAAAPGLVWGVATGRRPDSALEVLAEWGAPPPRVVVAAVGTEIYYLRGGDDGEPELVPDLEYALWIDHRWHREEVRQALESVEGLDPQPASEQRPYKVSFHVDPDALPSLREVDRRLNQHGLAARVVYSKGKDLDLLPVRASKGAAVTYLAEKWGLDRERLLVAGDSGNDRDMLAAERVRAVVVGNHADELESLKDREGVYFARGHHAEGVLEGAEHWGFLEP